MIGGDSVKEYGMFCLFNDGLRDDPEANYRVYNHKR